MTTDATTTDNTFQEAFSPTTAITRDDLRRQLNRGRTYVWPPNDPNAREYVSVTNALNSLPKEALPRWAAKLVAEQAVEKLPLLNQLADDDPEEAVKWLKGAPWAARDKAADIGTAVHEIVELDALDRSDEADAILEGFTEPAARAKAAQARDFFRKAPVDVLEVEFVVYDHQHGYAGTGDFIVRLKGDLAAKFPKDHSIPNWPDEPEIILDLKTGKGVYPEAALQMSAYRYGEAMVDLENGTMLTMPGTVGAAVLHVTEDAWSLIPVDAGPDTFQRFLRALALSRDLPLNASHVGTPVMRGKVPPEKTPAEKSREALWA